MPSNSRTSAKRTVQRRTVPGATQTTLKGKGISPSRLQRLDRTIAVLTEQTTPRDRSSDDDPWADVPEELEPVDEDALDEEDFLRVGERHRRPAIIYSRSSYWAPPVDSLPADPLGLSGDLRVTVRRPLIGRNDDPWTADLVGEELRRIAAALDHLQGRALRAASRPEAFAHLETVSQKRLAEVASISASTLARRRRELVEAPWGLAPLEFFWWKRDQGLSLAEARLLVQVLTSDPDVEARAAARRVAEACAAPSEVAKRTDAIRKQVPVMRSLLPLLPRLNLLAGALIEVDYEDLDKLVEDVVRSETGSELDKRGRGLVRLALAGAFEDAGEKP